jgi:hypothetical protein
MFLDFERTSYIHLHPNAPESALPRYAEIGPLIWIMIAGTVIHLLMIWGEVSLTHPTAHARLAIWEMVRGRYKSEFWMGLVLSLLGGLLPALALVGVGNLSISIGGPPFALIGMMLYEHAYVQAGQSVPLA